MKIKIKKPRVFVGGDYSQQEPRLLAHMSQDPELIKTYNEGKDLYVKIASMVLNLPEEECSEFYPDGRTNLEGKKIRAKFKGVVLGIMYSMGAYLMADLLDVSVEECKDILKKFFKIFPTIEKFVKDNEEFSMKHKYVQDYYGRRRHLDDLLLPDYKVEAQEEFILESPFFDMESGRYSITNKDLSRSILNELVETASKRNGFRLASEKQKHYEEVGHRILNNKAFISKCYTQTTNAIIQGGAATETKIAMLGIRHHPRLKELDVKVMVPVHDEILCECPLEHLEEVKVLLPKVMCESVADSGITVKQKVDLYAVKNWAANDLQELVYKMFSQTKDKEKLYNQLSAIKRESVDLMFENKFDTINGVL